MRTWITMAVAVLVALSATAARAQDGDEILGFWLTENEDAIVEVYKVGDLYHGKIVWLIRPFEADGDGPDLDDKNPDSALQSREVLGLELMQAFAYDGKNAYKKGKLYDPDSGNTYGGTMTLVGDDEMNLRGYVGVPMLGRTSHWTRHTGPFPATEPPPSPATPDKDAGKGP